MKMVALFVNNCKDICFRLIHKTSILIITLGLGVFISRGYFISHRRKGILQKKIKDKIEIRNRNIDSLRQSLANSSIDVQEKRIKIVTTDFNELRTLLSNDTYTPTEVLEAFQSRSLKVHDTTNCVCEFLPEAKRWAEDLEEKYHNSDKKPILYGIPISVKECFKLKGHDTTAGFAQYLDNPEDRNSSMISSLISLGAVPFVRTNIPQSMKSLGCSNPIYGLTTNPHDPSRSCGGSSGGEGALIGLHGSPLGLGTDIGGSIRIPAHYCGTYSLKPTIARVDQGGRRGAMPGCTAVLGTASPMGNSVDSLVWFLRGVCSIDSNPYAVPLPFNEKIYTSSKRLKIGFYDFDGFLEATPACKRAVHIAKAVLEEAGHTLVQFKPPETSNIISSYFTSVNPDGGAYVFNLFKNDIIDKRHKPLAEYFAIPSKLKLIFGWWLSRSEPKAAIPYLATPQNTSDLRLAYQMLSEYKEKFSNFWMDSSLDCVICPASTVPALPVNLATNLFGAFGLYCALYNALDFPAGVLPVTTVSEKDEKDLESYPTNDLLSKAVKFGTKGSVGLPIGIQVVALPFREEICLRVMKLLEDSLKASSCKTEL